MVIDDPRVAGKVAAMAKTLEEYLSTGSITVQNTRSYGRAFGGYVCWAAAQKLIADKKATVTKRTVVDVKKGPGEVGRRKIMIQIEPTQKGACLK